MVVVDGDGVGERQLALQQAEQKAAAAVEELKTKLKKKDNKEAKAAKVAKAAKAEVAKAKKEAEDLKAAAVQEKEAAETKVKEAKKAATAYLKANPKVDYEVWASTYPEAAAAQEETGRYYNAKWWRKLEAKRRAL